MNNSLGWTFEAKNTKTFQWKAAAEQVAREAMGYSKECIVWHPPNKPMEGSVAIINIEDFLALLKKVEDGKGREDILDKYQVKNSLEKAVYYLKQVVKNL